MKPILKLLFTLTLAMSVVKAQDTTGSYNHLNNRLGFAASMISGYGLSYQYDFSRSFTMEVTGSIYGSGGTSSSQSSYSNPYVIATLGFEAQRNLYFSDVSRFYGFGSFSGWIDYNSSESYSFPEQLPYKTYRDENTFITGVGIGLELIVAKHIGFNLEGGYLYRTSRTKGDNGRGTPRLYTESSYDFGFGVGGGIYYAF